VLEVEVEMAMEMEGDAEKFLQVVFVLGNAFQEQQVWLRDNQATKHTGSQK
jgi:hypothetical protein